MTFDENKVKRDKGGRFDNKAGSAPNVNLPQNITIADGQVFLDTLRTVGFARHEDMVLRDEVMKERAAGARHLYDHHYTDMWNGRAINIFGEHDGWSKEVVEAKLAHTTAVKEALRAGTISASDISENWTKQSHGIRWCEATERELNDALESEGRSLFKNAADARQRYADFEGGRNRR